MTYTSSCPIGFVGGAISMTSYSAAQQTPSTSERICTLEQNVESVKKCIRILNLSIVGPTVLATLPELKDY